MVISSDADIDYMHEAQAIVDACGWMFNENGELVRKPIQYPVVDGVTITIDGFSCSRAVVVSSPMA